VTGGQRTRGVEFSFTEPYFMDYRLAAGFDLFAKQNRNNSFSVYDSSTVGGTLRLGVPVTDEISFSPRYSLFQSTVKIPNDATRPYNDCSVDIGVVTGTVGPTNSCLSNGEASLAVKQISGGRITSQVGYTLSYNTLDNPRNPTQGIYAEFKQDVAGAGGDARFLRTTAEARYFQPVWDDVVGFAKVQGGNVTAFGGDTLRVTDNFNLGPSLVRGFAPGGIGPRDVSSGLPSNNNSLGGTNYVGGSVELQFPLFGMPKDLGLKGALFADAGTLFGYKGDTNFSTLFNLPANSACVPGNVPGLTKATNYTQATCITLSDSSKIRSSVGASILWASPLGPIRFDYAFVLTKAQSDVGQAFRFSGGGSF